MTESDQSKKAILIADDSLYYRQSMRKYLQEDYIIYDTATAEATLRTLQEHDDISLVFIDLALPAEGGLSVMRHMQQDSTLRAIPIISMTSSLESSVTIEALQQGAVDVMVKPLNLAVMKCKTDSILNRSADTKTLESIRQVRKELKLADTDEKSGLYTRNAFVRYTRQYLQEHPSEKLILMRWDIDNFKVYNDINGVKAGDEYLRKVGLYYLNHSENSKDLVLYGRYNAEHFVSLRKAELFNPKLVLSDIYTLLHDISPDFDFSVRIGLYAIDNPAVDVSLMCDRADMALQSLKQNYQLTYAWYDESMRKDLVNEHELINATKPALDNHEFIIYYQPIVNCSARTVVKAEALVRWMSPAKGLISPGVFIPVLEKSGLIYELDKYVWDNVCRTIRGWKDKGLNVPSISVNISRIDFYHHDIYDSISGLIEKYDLEPSYLNLEVTESAYMDDPSQLSEVIQKLRSSGFRIEMDDFGSGYSSLNTLKNMPVDSVKLDMNFINDNTGTKAENHKGGKILSSVVRMVHDIGLPIVAEGVETEFEAEYLKSIGCYLMQGYYFSKPLPETELLAFIADKELSDTDALKERIGKMDTIDFLEATPQSTLLFNTFIGGAGIVEYTKNTLSGLRLNDMFFKIIGVSRETYDPYLYDMMQRITPRCRPIMQDALQKAIDTQEESYCEIRTLPFNDGSEGSWLACRMRYLSKKAEGHLLFLSIENITKQKTAALSDSLYKSIFMNVPAGVAVYKMDSDQSISLQYVSDACCKLFNASKEEFFQAVKNGQTYGLMPTASDSAMNASVESSSSSIPFMHVKRKDGSWFWLKTIINL